MLFENNDYDYDFDIDILNLAGFNYNDPKSYYPYPEKDKLFCTKEGFLKGNMWQDEYIPYNGMPAATLNPKTERESLLYKIMEIDFAINDLNLYLDLHPENQKIYEKFKKLNEECIRLKDEYARTYGPLTIDQTPKNTYEWMKNPWPWDKSGGSMYV